MSHEPQQQIVIEEPDRVTLNTVIGGSGGRVQRQCEALLAKVSAEFHRRSLVHESWPIGLIPPGMVLRELVHRNEIVVFLIEVAPEVRTMQWICQDSPHDFGSGVTYRDVCLALPWLYFFIAMTPSGNLTHGSSVYFRNSQLRSPQDGLLEPHFHNCSVDAYGLHCWVCQVTFRRRKSSHESLADFALAFVDQFFFGGFNKSSEYCEGKSFWSKNQSVIQDGRVQTVEAWQEATAHDPTFALSVPWVDARRTVQDVYTELTCPCPEVVLWPPATVAAVAAIVKSQRKKKGTSHV